METQQVEDRLLRLVYLMGAGIVICQVLNQQVMTSMLFYGTFIIVLVLWFFTSCQEVSALDLLAIFIVFAAFIAVVVNGIMLGAEFSFQYFKKYIMFCCTIIYFALACKIKPDRTFRVFAEILYLLVGLVFIYMYVWNNAEMHLLNGIYTDYLVFRFTNPNTTAMFLTCMMMFLLAAVLMEQHFWLRAVLSLLAIIEAVFVYQTRSRTSLAVMCIFIVLYFLIYIFRHKEIKIKAWILWFIELCPIAFIAVYMFLISDTHINSLFSFFSSEGKDLDSRVKIWKNAISAFESSPLFGAYFQISDGTGTSQMHNSHLDILASYGIVVFVLFCIYVFVLLRKIQRENAGYKSRVAFAGFVCCLLLGIGEAAMFSGGLGIYLFAGIFIFTANQNSDVVLK